MLDTHCHIDLYPNPYQVLAEIVKDNITTVAVTNLPSHYVQAIPYVASTKSVRLALGLHPMFANKCTAMELKRFGESAAKTSYIGEVGLDFSREGLSTMELQLSHFHFVLRTIADRPRFVTIHSRGAEQDVLEMLTAYGISRTVYHWYSGPISLIDKIVAAGHYFSINPAMIRSAKGRSTIEQIPRDRVLTESDGPFVRMGNSPAMPSHVRLVVDYLAKSWKVPHKEVEQSVWANFTSVVTPIREWQSQQREIV